MPLRYPLALPLMFLVGALLGPLAPHVRAAPEKGAWRAEAPYKAILAAEAKAFSTLMKTALKEDFRRQAWFFADRVLAAKPGDPEAQKVLEGWSDEQLMAGRPPTPEYERKRDAALATAGDELARFAEILNGAGVEAEEYYELNARAASYGSRYAPLVAAMNESGYAALGTFHDQEVKTLTDAVGERWKDMTFPSPADDAYLRVRIAWPEAKVGALGPFKLITDLKVTEALRALVVLDRTRTYMVELLGGSGNGGATPIDVVLFSEGEHYLRLLPKLVEERAVKEALEGSSYHDRLTDRVFACWRHRTNAWIGEDAVLQGAVAPAVARRWFGQGTGAWVNGRGAWVLDGLAGVFEGVSVEGATGLTDLDPSRCWRLAAAKALRATGALLPWEQLLELDREKAKALERRHAQVAFRGGSFEAKDLDVAAIQGTAFVMGLVKADKGKGAKRAGDILRDLFKRDSLPDLEKLLGWKKGRWAAECEKAIDAATGN